MSLHVVIKHSQGNRILDLDLHIPNTGITAIFGPSGAGKTSLLRVIAGLDRIKDAQVSFNGQTLQSKDAFLPPHKRSIGLVFQQPSLFEHLSVEQNIQYSSRYAIQPNTRSGFDIKSLVSLLGIDNLMKRMPATLSGGEQQRVAIIRALAAQPKVLLMDEPLASLDRGLKRQFIDYFSKVIKQLSIPVVYVTHASEEVARLSDHAVLIDQGKITGQGVTKTMLTDLHQTFVTNHTPKTALTAIVTEHSEQDHVSRLLTPAGELWTSAVSEKVGNQVSLLIFARDISVTLSAQSDTSILNVLPAKILDFREAEQGSVIIKLAIGDAQVLSQISKKSFNQLALEKDLTVFAQIKSVAVW